MATGDYAARWHSLITPARTLCRRILATTAGLPGRPVLPWPLAVPGKAFRPPAGRGAARPVTDAATGRCAVCGRAVQRRLDRSVTEHKAGAERCEGSGQLPAADPAPGSWLPVLTGLTPHGLRHSHQTWLDAGVPPRDVQRQPRMLTREPRCPNDRTRGSPDRHATHIVAAYIASAARSSTLARSPA